MSIASIPQKVVGILEKLIPYDEDEYIQWILDNQNNDKEVIEILEEIIDEQEFIDMCKGFHSHLTNSDVTYLRNYISSIIYKYAKLQLYRKIKGLIK